MRSMFTETLAPLAHRITGNRTRANPEAMSSALTSKVESGA